MKVSESRPSQSQRLSRAHRLVLVRSRKQNSPHREKRQHRAEQLRRAKSPRVVADHPKLMRLRPPQDKTPQRMERAHLTNEQRLFPTMQNRKRRTYLRGKLPLAMSKVSDAK